MITNTNENTFNYTIRKRELVESFSIYQNCNTQETVKKKSIDQSLGWRSILQYMAINPHRNAECKTT